MADRRAELRQHQRAQTDLRRSTLLSAAGGRACRGYRLYFTDAKAVIAQAKRRKGAAKLRVSARRARCEIAGRRAVGVRLAALAALDERVEVGAAGDAGRIPPDRRGIVGDRGERAAHTLGADADASAGCAPARETKDTGDRR